MSKQTPWGTELAGEDGEPLESMHLVQVGLAGEPGNRDALSVPQAAIEAAFDR